MAQAVTTTFTGATWGAIRVAMVYAFDAANGRLAVPGPTVRATSVQVIYPRLSNAQAIAILAAFRGRLVAAPRTLWPLWWTALGYEREGDKFDTSTARGGASYDDIATAKLWEFVGTACDRLDLAHAEPRILVLDYSYKAWERSAVAAYAALRVVRAQRARSSSVVPMPPGIEPPDVGPITSPIPDPPLPVIPTPGGGGAAILLLLLAALALRKSRRN